MSSTFFVDVANSVLTSSSIVPQVIASSGVTSGSAVDLITAEGPVSLLLMTGATGDATLTLDCKLQESDTSGGTYSDITGSSITQLTGSTAADNTVQFVTTGKRTKRYVKAVLTLGGSGTISVAVAATVIARRKITGSGTGYQS